MNIDNIIPVILCGGSGTRLWPLSRESYPKQFLNINAQSTKSLLQQTQERISNLENVSPPILICNQNHRFIVAEQMREIGIKPKAIILEPSGRNTAPAVTLAALKSQEIKKDQILLVLSSDHLIHDNKEFIKSIKYAVELAQKDRLVTFGVIPTSPETGFGYIESADELNIEKCEGSDIKKFVEKPDRETAEKFILDKRYSWNSGMFVFKANNFLSELKKYAPSVLDSCKDSIKKEVKDLDFQRIDEKAFKKCSSISIDVAVMEKTNIGSVVPLKAKWSDVGNWKSLWEYEEKNNDGNLIKGKVILKDVKNSCFFADSRLLVGIGLENIVAVETSDVIFLSAKDQAEKVKGIVNELKEKKIDEAINHKKVFRPWGSYFSVASGETWQVKKIEVNPGASLSLQMHHHRAEHWIVVKGTAKITINEKEMILGENQSTFIPLGSKHKLSNPGKLILTLVEVQSGTYLGEDDIVRFEDIYGRLNN